MTHNDQEATLYTPLKTKVDDLRHSAISNISPMELETADADNIKQSNLCIRFLRKKFICIVVLLLTIITIANVFNTFIGKLSENDVSSIFNFLKTSFSSSNKTFFNVSDFS
ncbi:hypothetical protein [Aeromonas sobria]|uniref:hypothetical protein n=1 Tax=Aeromonas sobria TaxID=646 RepID=UPI003F3C3D04